MRDQTKKSESGFGHLLAFLMIIVVVAAIAFVGAHVYKKNKDAHDPSKVSSLGDPNSKNALQKGLALSNGECEGQGSKPLTHSPMDPKDIGSIEPLGLMLGGHVTPVSHEYYYQKDKNAPVDTYPVYADADGYIVAVGDVNNSGTHAWQVTIAHSCTFLTNYNLITSITDDIKSKLPEGWGPNSNGGVKIPVKSGQLIGHVGHQSLDYEVWDTTKTVKGLLYPIAYNNREPSKLHTVRPLDYFTDAVKEQILPYYARKVEPLDGKMDYDVSGEAVGTWFLDGTNGYAGNGDVSTASYQGHLSMAYDYIDAVTPILSIGDYQGSPTQFNIVGSVDWTKITPQSGVAKVQLKAVHSQTATATALIQLTAKDNLKLELFPGKSPAQVSGFDSGAKGYNRGQNATMIKSTTAQN